MSLPSHMTKLGSLKPADGVVTAVPQADWDESDSNSPAFVANKPDPLLKIGSQRLAGTLHLDLPGPLPTPSHAMVSPQGLTVETDSSDPSTGCTYGPKKISVVGANGTRELVVPYAAGTLAVLVNNKMPAENLPSYVDDVLEYASSSAFPATGETGKIYVAKDENKTYRWSGTQYVQIGGSSITVDDALSDSSTNPVQNKVVKAALDGKATAAQGAKADAALSRAEAKAGFMEWKCTGIDSGYEIVSEPHMNDDDPTKWIMQVRRKSDSTFFDGEIDNSAPDATELHFTLWDEDYSLESITVTATRTRLPTMADLALKADKSEMTVTPGTGADADKTTIQLKDGTSATALTAHQQLSPVYGGNGQKFSAWTFSDGVSHVVMGPLQYSENDWRYYIQDGPTSYETFGTEALASAATSLTFSDSLSSTRTANPIIGYTLGGQTTKPLQPKGDYQPTLTAAQLANIAAVPNKADASALSYSLVAKTPTNGSIALSDRAVNLVNPTVTVTTEWTWADGETGTPIFSNGYWTVQNASFDTYDGPVAGSASDTEITFAKTDTKSFYLAMTDYDYETDNTVFVFNVGGEGGDEVRAEGKWSDNYDENIVESIEYDGVEYALEYPATEFNTGSTYSGIGTVAEHVVSLVTTYGPTITLSMPPQNALGRVRDLISRIDLSQVAGIPPVAFSGGAFEAVDGEMPELVKGVNLLSFTETASGVFAVAYKEVKPIAQGGS